MKTSHFVHCIVLFAILFFGGVFSQNKAVYAQDVEISTLIKALNAKSFSKKIKAIENLVATGHERSVPVLEAMKAGKLYYRKSDQEIFIIQKKGSDLKLTNAISGQDAGVVPKSELKKIRVNNRLRKKITSSLGSLKLFSPLPDERLNAANAVFRSGDAVSIKVIDKAIKNEKDSVIRKALTEARAANVVYSKDVSENEKLIAIGIIKQRSGIEALNFLKALSLKSSGQIKLAAQQAAQALEQHQKFLSFFRDIIFGLSLGSVLLLAAIGLAITFGVMGVINMAHGEMVMIGAYTAFVVQGLVAASAPVLSPFSLLISIPVAFLIAGGIGVIMERTIIRYMYNRPLDTLLATWGVSLILQQAVRTIFGPTNQNVQTPDWLTGRMEFVGLSLTYNRIAIIIFALIVFCALLFILKKTFFGLQMRAVTQNRSMAASMGISTKWVDALTFGLGSGIAGIAGVALSQIANVSPNLGQSYIIDSFMVVVFGGVGNLWGTLVGAFSLGIVNKFLEPYAGAIIAKILVLVFIILFIQKRPRGLFAQKGRAVES